MPSCLALRYPTTMRHLVFELGSGDLAHYLVFRPPAHLMLTMRYTSDVPNRAIGATSAVMSACGIECYIVIYHS